MGVAFEISTIHIATPVNILSNCPINRYINRPTPCLLSCVYWRGLLRHGMHCGDWLHGETRSQQSGNRQFSCCTSLQLVADPLTASDATEMNWTGQFNSVQFSCIARCEEAFRQQAQPQSWLQHATLNIRAWQTLGPMNSTAATLLCDLGRRATARTNKTRETSFLFQRLSLNIERFNSVLIHESLISTGHQDQWPFQHCF